MGQSARPLFAYIGYSACSAYGFVFIVYRILHKTSKVELIKYSDDIIIKNKVKNNLKNIRKVLDKTRNTGYNEDTNKERQNK